MSEGIVYLITTPTLSADNWYKVGITQDLTKRLGTYQTASPNRNFFVVHSIKHPNIELAEKKIQENMKFFAFQRKKEWFQIPLHMAISRLDDQLGAE